MSSNARERARQLAEQQLKAAEDVVTISRDELGAAQEKVRKAYDQLELAEGYLEAAQLTADLLAAPDPMEN